MVVEPDPERAVAYGIFSVRQARAAGFSEAETRRRIRRGQWHRLGGGLLQTEGRRSRPGDDLVRALLRAGPGAVVGLESAAAVHGWDCADQHGPPRILLPESATRRPGFRTRLSASDVVICGILPVTTPARTAFDLACTLPYDPAVIAVDSALRSRQTSMEELTSCFADQRRGVIAARRALQAADPASGSVPETEARLLFARAGLPRPVTQRVVWADGRCYVLDFAWEEEMLGAEIDGFRYHSATGDYQRDREKQNAVQLGGWFVLRFTVADIRFNGSRTVAQLEEARSFRRRRMS